MIELRTLALSFVIHSVIKVYKFLSLRVRSMSSDPAIETYDAKTMDIANVLLKIKEQQSHIETLQAQVNDKDKKLNDALVERKKEMAAYMDGIKNYLAKMKESMSETDINQFIVGLERCVESGERNPIFEVMCCASKLSDANVNETERLRTENEDLKRHVQGGFFGDAAQRTCGVKRAADEIEGGSTTSFWDSFQKNMVNQ